jgi:hypothetical protein
MLIKGVLSLRFFFRWKIPSSEGCPKGGVGGSMPQLRGVESVKISAAAKFRTTNHQLRTKDDESSLLARY